MDYAVIMAGGTGKRLWPLSRKDRPKQVLKLLDDQTLLRCCFERLLLVFDERNILVLTNAGYADIVRENLPELPYNNVIAEPAVRDTAGAIGLAAAILERYNPQATMTIVTADQVIEPAETLQQAITDARTFVKANPEHLVTFGIKPTFPSTQLGYLDCTGPAPCEGCSNELYKVHAFREKPDVETARKYLETGRFFWNSGMFIWKAGTILRLFERFLPDAIEPLYKIREAWDTPDQGAKLQEWFVKLPKISIDYAIMEKAEKVSAIQLDCRWLDLGSFAALADIVTSDEKGNVVVAAESLLLDCKDNIVVTEDKGHMIALIGLENMVVAHSPDATLVCRVDDTGRLKELLDHISDRGGERFL